MDLYLRTQRFLVMLLVILFLAFIIFTLVMIRKAYHILGFAAVKTEEFPDCGIIVKEFMETRIIPWREANQYITEIHYHTIVFCSGLYYDLDERTSEVYGAVSEEVNVVIRKDTLKDGTEEFYIVSVNDIKCFGETIQKSDITD